MSQPSDGGCHSQSTHSSVKLQLVLPELQEEQTIEWDFHVAETLGAHAMILGRNILGFLGIDIKFSNHRVEWGDESIPFKDDDD